MSASKSTRWLTAPGGDGPEIRIPVATVTGANEGPTVLIVGGVHGSEYVGQEAVRRLHQTVDPAELSGTLITVPVFGIPAFYGLAAHISPEDGLNPGSSFPGRPDGSHTERACNLLWTELVEQADFVVDVHGGDLEEELTEYTQVDLTGDDELDAKAIAFARGFGFRLLVTAPPKPRDRVAGGLFSMAASAGKVGILTEAGSHGDLDHELADWYHDRLLDGLRGVGALPGAGSDVEPQILYRFGGAFAPESGCWYPDVKKDDTVSAGQRMGEMRDMFGEKLCDIYSEDDAVVLGVMTIPPREKGQMLVGYATVAP